MSHDQETLEAARNRLVEFAAEIGVRAPGALLSKSGAPSREVMDFRKQHKLTLDWIYCGANRKFQDAQHVEDHERPIWAVRIAHHWKGVLMWTPFSITYFYDQRCFHSSGTQV